MGSLFSKKPKMNKRLLRKIILCANKKCERAILYLAKYYKKIGHKRLMIRYYEKATDLGNSEAMTLLGEYYEAIYEYDLMKYYYVFAIEEDKNVIALNRLAVYYYDTKEYEWMFKYLNIGIEMGNSHAMNRLGMHYERIEDVDNAKKYYLMAAQKGNRYAIHNVGVLYNNLKEYDNMLQYYNMAIEKGSIKTFRRLVCYYYDIEDYDNMFLTNSKAIAAGCVTSMLITADHYSSKYDFTNMLIYLKLAARKRSAEAFVKLGNYYYRDLNYPKIKHYFNLYLDKLIKKKNLIVIPNNENTCDLKIYADDNYNHYENIKYIETTNLLNEKIRRLYKRFDIDYTNITKKIKYMNLKKKKTIIDDCPICYETSIPLIPFDCSLHYYCEYCYHLLNMCGFCMFEKNRIMKR